MINKTETEIMKNWKTQENPVVSILCATYNHENYIEEALDSFLMQETNFPFKIIIHDDASTDNTVNKIKLYAKKYPHIIKTILQKENQYSQGKRIFSILFKNAKGKYYAICEGDDYWIDSKKLQIQIDLMEQTPKCHMSFHPTETRLNKDKNGKIFGRYANTNKIFSTSEVILGGGGFCPSASIVLRKEVLSILPDFYTYAPVGDYFIQIFGSLNGGALYIDKVMSVYRQGIPNSWSTVMNDVYKREKFTQSMIEILDKLDIYLNSKYQNEIKEIISYYYFEMAFYYLKSNMFNEFKESIELSYNANKIKFIYFIIYSLRSFPRLIKLLLRIRDVFR